MARVGIGCMFGVVATLLASGAMAPARADEVSQALSQARAAYESGDFEAALAAYQVVVETRPEAPMLRMRIGQCLYRLGRWQDAATAFSLAAEQGAPVALFGLEHAGSLARAGDRAGALGLMRKLAEGGAVRAEVVSGHADFVSLATDPGFAETLDLADRATRPCMYDPRARAFDFWVGEWDVYAQGGLAGTSRVEKILDGCVLLENWSGVAGDQGKSFNLWDKEGGRWQQTWADNRGKLLEFYGTFIAPGTLVYEGEGSEQAAGSRDRLTFSLLEEGNVRQLWERSADGGATWSVLFDGEYRRRQVP